MDQAVVNQLFLGAWPPATMAFGGAALIEWLRRRGTGVPVLDPAGVNRQRATNEALQVLVVVVAVIVAHAIAFNGVKFPPRSAFDWMPLLTAAAALPGLLISRSTRLCAAAALVVAALFAGATPVVLKTSLVRPLGLDAAALIASWAAIGGLTAWASARTARAERFGAIVLAIPASGSAMMLLLGQYSMLHGQSAGIVAAALAGVALASALGGRLAPGIGVVAALVVTFAHIQGQLFAPSPRSWVFTGLTAAGFVLPAFVRSETAPRLRRSLLRLALASAPVAVGVGLAIATRVDGSM